MAEIKTVPTAVSVPDFLAAVEPPRRREEGLQLDALFREVTGWEPQMWGPSIVGYGRYAYVYESGHRGEMAVTGFSPRKAECVLYVMPGYGELGELLGRLGPHRIGKSCLYLRRLDLVDRDVLAELIRFGVDDVKRRWPVTDR